MVSLRETSFVVSVNPRRRSLQKRWFMAAGLPVPRAVEPICPAVSTRVGEPRGYSGLALNVVELLLGAMRSGQEAVLLFEDDAVPRPDAELLLRELLLREPLPTDCGILCLGDINGASRWRGRQTRLMADCGAVYTPLVPRVAENKGSHAVWVRRGAFLPLVQAIIENGVTDLALSRIQRYGPLRAYGLFRSPLFLQLRDATDGPRFLAAEAYAEDPAAAEQDFPVPEATSLLRPDVGHAEHFFIMSNATRRQADKLPHRDDAVAVFLTRAVEADSFAEWRRVLLCRQNVRRPGEWFLPHGQELRVADYWEDALLPTDAETERAFGWFADYKRETGRTPSTGWVAWKLLREFYPQAQVTLVDFDPAGDIGTYKWPGHDWAREAADYAAAGAEILHTI